MANAMNCVIISKKEDELYNIRVGIIIAQRNVEAMKRPVPIYDFTAFGKAIKEARTKRGESRKNVSDDMDISPRYEKVDSVSFSIGLCVGPGRL